jgi:hypothetical protein
MRKIFLSLGLLLTLIITHSALAGTGAVELKKLSIEVAALELGFKDYILGGTLTPQQKEIAQNNNISKTLKGTYKFQDGDIYVVAKTDDDTVLGIYKNFPQASREDVKIVVGDMMMRFTEPTTMAHDKLIYWAFSKDGKISGDEYGFSKSTGDTDMIATVKLQSSVPILPDPEKSEKKEGEGDDFKKEIEAAGGSLYIIISSNPMSKIFLANNKQ